MSLYSVEEHLKHRFINMATLPKRPNSQAGHQQSPQGNARTNRPAANKPIPNYMNAIGGTNGNRAGARLALGLTETSDVDYQPNFTESNNFLEEFVNQAIRNYDKTMQKRLLHLDAAFYQEVEHLTKRLNELESAVATVKEEAANSSKVIEALVDLGKKSKLNNKGGKWKGSRTVALGSLSEGSAIRTSAEMKSRPTPNIYSDPKQRGPHPPTSPRPSSLVNDRNDRQQYDDELNLFEPRDDYYESSDAEMSRGRDVERSWNNSSIVSSGIEGVGESALDGDNGVVVRARSVSPEKGEDAAANRAFAKFEELISNMGFNITTRMSNLEVELGECRNLFGQVSLAAERLTLASQQATQRPIQFSAPYPVGGAAVAGPFPQQLFAQPFPYPIDDGSSSGGAGGGVGGGYTVVPMYSSPGSSYGRPVYGLGPQQQPIFYGGPVGGMDEFGGGGGGLGSRGGQMQGGLGLVGAVPSNEHQQQQQQQFSLQTPVSPNPKTDSAEDARIEGHQLPTIHSAASGGGGADESRTISSSSGKRKKRDKEVHVTHKTEDVSSRPSTGVAASGAPGVPDAPAQQVTNGSGSGSAKEAPVVATPVVPSTAAVAETVALNKVAPPQAQITAESILTQIMELESRHKTLNKEKAKARKAIKVWVDSNTKEGQEPTDEQKEEAKRLFQQHVQVVQEKESIEKRLEELRTSLSALQANGAPVTSASSS